MQIHCCRTALAIALGLLAAAPAQAQTPAQRPALSFQVGSSFRIALPGIYGTFRVTGPMDANGMLPVLFVGQETGLEVLGTAPLWINTRQVVLVQEVTPEMTAAAAAEAALSAVRSDLRNLISAQEMYFADSMSYTANVRRLNFTASSGVTVTITSATRTGWAGTAVHARVPGQICGVFVGNARPPVAGQEQGEPRCRAR
jgi:hypothetical protein